MTYPDLGDSNKTYTVEFTEPELNAIAAMIGYTRDGILEALTVPARHAVPMHAQEIMRSWLNHYRVPIDSIDKKLERIEVDEAVSV